MILTLHRRDNEWVSVFFCSQKLSMGKQRKEKKLRLREMMISISSEEVGKKEIW